MENLVCVLVRNDQLQYCIVMMIMLMMVVVMVSRSWWGRWWDATLCSHNRSPCCLSTEPSAPSLLISCASSSVTSPYQQSSLHRVRTPTGCLSVCLSVCVYLF